MDRVSAKTRSANMRAIKSKDMLPELKVRKLVHKLGYRFRLHRSTLPGRPDLVFPKLRKVIFVHGCFWHQHSSSTCQIAHSPRSNKAYWKPKFARNIKRDRDTRKKLKVMGWDTLVIWECATKESKSKNLSSKITNFLSR
jgi:DNA mismatch endonuclease (patch repair protein)